MAYSINDIMELINYHLVAAAPDDEAAERNLSLLIESIEQLRNVDETLHWMVCEECGAWVSSELIGPNGAGESDDGGFRCTECRFDDEEADEGLGDSDLAIHERIIDRPRSDLIGAGYELIEELRLVPTEPFVGFRARAHG